MRACTCVCFTYRGILERSERESLSEGHMVVYICKVFVCWIVCVCVHVCVCVLNIGVFWRGLWGNL